MALDRVKLDRMIAKADAWLTQREQEQAARHDSEDRQLEEGLARGNTMPTPTQPFSDSPPDMPKEPLWGGKPPIPISHL